MALSETVCRDKIWKRTGLSQSELEEPVINEAIVGALGEFNKYKTNYKYGPLPVVAGEPDIAFPTDVTDIIDVLYPGDSSSSILTGSFTMEDALLLTLGGPFTGGGFGGNIFENPSLTEIFYGKLRSMRATFGMPGWRVLDGETPKIRLDRIPTANGTAYYEGSQAWTVAKILPKDEENFMKVLMWKVAEVRAMDLAVVASLSDGTGVSVVPAHQFWKEMAEEYEQKFLESVGATRGSMVIG